VKSLGVRADRHDRRVRSRSANCAAVYLGTIPQNVAKVKTAKPFTEELFRFLLGVNIRPWMMVVIVRREHDHLCYLVKQQCRR
jgi:hypothetical protein